MLDKGHRIHVVKWATFSQRTLRTRTRDEAVTTEQKETRISTAAMLARKHARTQLLVAVGILCVLLWLMSIASIRNAPQQAKALNAAARERLAVDALLENQSRIGSIDASTGDGTTAEKGAVSENSARLDRPSVSDAQHVERSTSGSPELAAPSQTKPSSSEAREHAITASKAPATATAPTSASPPAQPRHASRESEGLWAGHPAQTKAPVPVTAPNSALAAAQAPDPAFDRPPSRPASEGHETYESRTPPKNESKEQEAVPDPRRHSGPAPGRPAAEKIETSVREPVPAPHKTLTGSGAPAVAAVNSDSRRPSGGESKAREATSARAQPVRSTVDQTTSSPHPKPAPLGAPDFIHRKYCGSWQFGAIGKRNIGQVPIGAIFSAHVLRAYRDTSVKYEAALFADLEQNLHLGKDIVQNLTLAIKVYETNEQFRCENGYVPGTTRNIVITCPIRNQSATEKYLEENFRVTAELFVHGVSQRIRPIGLCLNEPIHSSGEPVAHLLQRALRVKEPDTLAVCLYLRNQRWRLMEWLSYYIAHGVDHVYIYKNENDDFTEAFVGDLVKQGKVTIVNWAHALCGIPYDRSQYTAVNDCFWTLRYKYDWVALFDVDEVFISKNSSEKLVDFVQRPEFEQVSVLELKTRKHCFDTQKKLPASIKAGGYLGHLAFRSEAQDNRKNIVRPDEVGWGWLHTAHFLKRKSVKVPFEEAELMHVQAVELAEALGFETWLGHKVDPSCNIPLGSSPATRVVPDLQRRVQENWQRADRTSFDFDQRFWDDFYFKSRQDFLGKDPCRGVRECCLTIET
ncbi:Glycosyltransferase family 92 protein [Porphyridium purpureum]|uniref:Glycosyltransferase family 92 protein n=1 Tax=Porphyridium purpureum TaxID=35688 RepID=A0A5J4Z3G7_PORPP|nr:Glycosyltransferase family 92 protein [Porphyridium purpureum]|eukprot:POR5523..scf295_1